MSDLDSLKDIPGYKAIMKSVLKSQIQLLLEQLSENTGEESIILTASVHDGTLSHLGSCTGKGFLEGRDEIKSQFLGYCLKTHHKQKTQETRSPYQRSHPSPRPPPVHHQAPPPKRPRPQPAPPLHRIPSDSAIVKEEQSDNMNIHEQSDFSGPSHLPASLHLAHTQTSSDHDQTHPSEDNVNDTDQDNTIVKIEPISEQELDLEITGVEMGDNSMMGGDNSGSENWGQGQMNYDPEGDGSMTQGDDQSGYKTMLHQNTKEENLRETFSNYRYLHSMLTNQNPSWVIEKITETMTDDGQETSVSVSRGNKVMSRFKIARNKKPVVKISQHGLGLQDSRTNIPEIPVVLHPIPNQQKTSPTNIQNTSYQSLDKLDCKLKETVLNFLKAKAKGGTIKVKHTGETEMGKSHSVSKDNEQSFINDSDGDEVIMIKMENNDSPISKKTVTVKIEKDNFTDDYESKVFVKIEDTGDDNTQEKSEAWQVPADDNYGEMRSETAGSPYIKIENIEESIRGAMNTEEVDQPWSNDKQKEYFLNFKKQIGYLRPMKNAVGTISSTPSGETPSHTVGVLNTSMQQKLRQKLIQKKSIEKIQNKKEKQLTTEISDLEKDIETLLEATPLEEKKNELKQKKQELNEIIEKKN